ncbi:MAG: HNH endonuclease [Syntrophobacteraceae bacterium]|nr:HNH endonuclease [Syntrophobacteraceae bacterium]
MSSTLDDPSFLVAVPPEAIRRQKEKARALRKTQWWQRQIARGICHYCRKRVPPCELTMDHVVPLARGGLSTKGNVVPSCKTCNSRKKYLVPVEWEEYVQSLSWGADAPLHFGQESEES